MSYIVKRMPPEELARLRKKPMTLLSRFTPGPWRRESHYYPESQGESFTPYIVDSDGQNVAAAMMRPHCEGEFVANANLIASAPQMYGTLMMCADALRRALAGKPVKNADEILAAADAIFVGVRKP